MTVVLGVVGKLLVCVVDTNRFHACDCSLSVGQESVGKLSLLQAPTMHHFGIIAVFCVAYTTSDKGMLEGVHP